jgi:N-acyl-D-glutamate deacylase
MEAIRKASLIPAQILETAAPMMRNKGRIRVGADADLVVFDPATVADRATYEDPLQRSVGYQHVIVNGVFVLKDGEMVVGALPGRPVRGPYR